MDTNDLIGVKPSRELLGLSGVEGIAKGLDTKKPIIFFDVSNITNKSIKELSDFEINKAGVVESTYQKLDDFGDIIKEYSSVTIPSLLPLTALSPIIYSNTYDSKVTGKTPEELRDIKKGIKNK